ncbi:MAG: hypothetical protein B5M54_03790 [Candidatus Aminicenantes bacterium 4484_214]|nr:MAG: hypothetical protein B5M54_03790 [Candidatus Aminicenantes bacterium 4484_214]
MSQYLIGPAGWSYDDWQGIVYPHPQPSSFHPLYFLPRLFDIIEINSTFYRPPSLRISLSWLKKIAAFPHFQLSVKLHQVFSHERGNYSPQEVNNFKLGLEPLQAQGRLAAILIQFPWSFTMNQANFKYLTTLLQHFSEYPLVVEVRHLSWHQKSFFQMLHDYGVAFCNIDQPLFRHSLPPTTYATTKNFAYVRLHGRNAKDWFRSQASRDERYNYLYSSSEIAEWVEKIKVLKQKADKVIVITNNHYRGQAVVNALQIKNALTGERFPLPPSLVATYPQLKSLSLTTKTTNHQDEKAQKKLSFPDGDD